MAGLKSLVAMIVEIKQYCQCIVQHPSGTVRTHPSVCVNTFYLMEGGSRSTDGKVERHHCSRIYKAMVRFEF